MRIADVRCHVLRAPLERPFAWSQSWARVRGGLLVEVVTDEGLVGWGEAGAGWEQEAARAVIDSMFRPLLLGRDPLDVAVIWDTLHAAMLNGGLARGIAVQAMSGVDVALYTRFVFRDFVAQRAFDIAQPDVTNVGGLTESRRIAALTTTFGVQCFPHVWGTPIALAAGLHLLAHLPLPRQETTTVRSFDELPSVQFTGDDIMSGRFPRLQAQKARDLGPIYK